MNLNEKGSLEYITFDNLEKTGLVHHCFSTRKGGTSEGFYATMNMGFKRGDKREHVQKNYEILCREIGVDYRNLVLGAQKHTTNIRVVTEEDRGKGIVKESDIDFTDGMVTNTAHIALTVFGADCVPIFFVDTVKKAIGVCHAGWRGTVNGIVLNVLEKLKENYDCNPKDVKAAIGPSIGQCCFQVDDPVVKEFREKLHFADDVIVPDKEERKYKIDLWKTNALLLENAGVLKENIEITDLCTKCNPELFYSHRVMQEKRGIMVGILELK